MKTKFKIIETPEYYLAVSDEKPTVGNQIIYETDTQSVNTTCSDYTENEFDFVIKAYQPKGNASELDLPLLPEMVVEPRGFDEFEYSEEDLRKAINMGIDLWMNSMTEDSAELIEADYQKIIQSLKQSKTPKWFVAEISCDYIGCPKLVLNGTNSICCGDKTGLKTTTINGKTYLVGSYLFE